MKVLISHGEREQDIKYLDAFFQELSSNDLDIELVNHRKELNISKAWMPYELDEKYKSYNEKLFNFYNKIEKKCEDKDCLLVLHEVIFHPEFIKKLSQSTYTSYFTSDDPDGSYYCSQPYAWAFDHIFHAAVYYDEISLMSNKLKEWGAKKTSLIPLGYRDSSFNKNIKEKDLFNKKRTNEIIYVGVSCNKLERLLKIKKEFRNKFKIYGNWGGVKSVLYRQLKYGFPNYIRPISQEKLINLYLNTKIGINMHMSYGPSNYRLWELPINGVMQITDNEQGTNNFYKINEEIVCYENGNTKELIEKIKYYLYNDEERIRIAKAGYKKTKKNYSTKISFEKLFNKIKDNIKIKKLKQ